jgi:uncharacterized protein YbjT (DUF2867 family)
MKILVTGATGTVGRHLVEQLNKDGHQVQALIFCPSPLLLYALRT